MKRQVVVVRGPATPLLYREVDKGIEAVLHEAGCHELRLHVTKEMLVAGRGPEGVLKEIRHEAAGLLAVFVEMEAGAVAALEEMGIPAVFVGSHQTGLGRASVTVDHADGARRAARALIDIGRRRIGFVGPGAETGRIWGERIDAVREVAEAEHLPFESEIEHSFDMDEAGLATRRLLERAPETDGIVYPADLQAIGGIKALAEMGVSVPLDVAVIGFDDTDAARAAHPPLSSVHQPFREMGEAGTRLLLRAVAGEPIDPPRLRLPIELVLRGSCLPRSPSAGAAAGAAAAAGWHLRADDKSYGPFDEESLAGFLRPTTWIRHETHAPEWRQAQKVPALSKALHARRPALEWWTIRSPGGEAQGPYTRRALVAKIDSREVKPEHEVRHHAWEGFKPLAKTRFAARFASADADLSGFTPAQLAEEPRRRGIAAAAGGAVSGIPLRTTFLAVAAALLLAVGWAFWGRANPPPLEEIHPDVVRCGGPADADCRHSERSRCICANEPRFCGCRPSYGACGMPSCVSYKRAVENAPPPSAQGR